MTYAFDIAQILEHFTYTSIIALLTKNFQNLLTHFYFHIDYDNKNFNQT